MCRDEWQDDLSHRNNFDLDGVAVNEYLRWLYSDGSFNILSGRLDNLSKDNLSDFIRDTLRFHSVAELLRDEIFLNVTKALIVSGWQKVGAPIVDSYLANGSSDLKNFLDDAVKAIYGDGTINGLSRIFFLAEFATFICRDPPTPRFDNVIYPQKYQRELGVACQQVIGAQPTVRKPFSNGED